MVQQAQEERQSAQRRPIRPQFVAASELCKRGYQVALTMGLHPAIDYWLSALKAYRFSRHLGHWQRVHAYCSADWRLDADFRFK